MTILESFASAYTSALTSDDPNQWRKVYAQDVLWAGPAGIGTLRGLDTLIEQYQQPLARAFPGRKLNLVQTIIEGEWIAVATTQTATFSDLWLGIPPTRTTVELRTMDFVQVARDGDTLRAVEVWALTDILYVLEQIGYHSSAVLRWIGQQPSGNFGPAPLTHDPAELTNQTVEAEDNSKGHKRIVADMYGSLNESVLGLMNATWFDDMVWRGPYPIGTKNGLDDFEHTYRDPFITAFPDKSARDIVRIAQGDWIAGAGYQNTTFAADWLGIPATQNKIMMRYMDFWRVENRDGDTKLAENWVLIDILGVLEQAGYNVTQVLQRIGEMPVSSFKDNP